MTELDLESFEKTESKGKRSINREINEAKPLQELFSGWNIEESDEVTSSGYNNLDECLGAGSPLVICILLQAKLTLLKVHLWRI